MAVHTSKVETKRRYIVSVPSPCFGADIGKAWSSAKQAAQAYGFKTRDLDYDDFYTFEAWDEEIRISFALKDGMPDEPSYEMPDEPSYETVGE